MQVSLFVNPKLDNTNSLTQRSVFFVLLNIDDDIHNHDHNDKNINDKVEENDNPDDDVKRNDLKK